MTRQLNGCSTLAPSSTAKQWLEELTQKTKKNAIGESWHVQAILKMKKR